MNIQMSKNEMINIISLFTEKANASGLIEPMIAWEMKEAITPSIGNVSELLNISDAKTMLDINVLVNVRRR
jgi:hypothetical protein